MRFIRDIINEKTQAASKGDKSALRYPLRLREQDRTNDTPDALEQPTAADDLAQMEQISRRDPPAQNENTMDAHQADKDMREDRVDYSAIASALRTQQTAQPTEPARQECEISEQARPVQDGKAAYLTDRAASVAAPHTAQSPFAEFETQASTQSTQPDLSASDTLGDVLADTLEIEAPTTPQKSLAQFDDIYRTRDTKPEKFGDPEEPKQVAEPQTYVGSGKPAYARESEAAPVAERAQLAAQVVQEPSSSLDVASLPSSVSAHKPANGRGSKGRVKTRLLGFSAPQHPVHDPMSQSHQAAPAVHAQFPVGWLVVVDGPGRGASYSVFEGLTQIGRGESQTVRLDFGDNTISRENHAAIAFDGEQRRFFFGHGGKANLVRLNGRPVLSTEDLATNSVIRIGETTLRFVALCGDGFSWGSAEMEDQ